MQTKLDEMEKVVQAEHARYTKYKQLYHVSVPMRRLKDRSYMRLSTSKRRVTFLVLLL